MINSDYRGEEGKKMRKRKINQAVEQKRILMKALTEAENKGSHPQIIEDYRHAVNRCDVAIGRMRGLLVAFMLSTMFLGGCCTMKGALEDTSWILRTTADNIQPKQEK